MSSEDTPHIAESIHAASIYAQHHGPGPVPAYNLGDTISSFPISSAHHLEHDRSDVTSYSTGIVDQSRSIRPTSKRPALPPIPDLRFQQSYLASLKGAETWGSVAWITIRDQVMLPLIQGTLWTLALSGWRYWNRGAHTSGRTVGIKIRELWWKLNNWKLSED